MNDLVTLFMREKGRAPDKKQKGKKSIEKVTKLISINIAQEAGETSRPNLTKTRAI